MRVIPVLVLGTWAAACGGAAGTPADGSAGTDSSPATDTFVATPECLPACWRTALAGCEPQGTCVGAVAAPGSTAANGSVWSCFSNGVHIHTSKTTNMSVVTSSTEVFDNGTACRTIVSEEGPMGATFTVKDGAGLVTATARITTFPGVTLVCGDTEIELDRRTDCGRTALLLLAPIAGAGACGAGPCEGP